MGSESQKRLGVERAGDLLRAEPENLFIVGYDGVGGTATERVEWLKAIFPKLVAKIDAVKNRKRADAEVPAWFTQSFSPRHAPAIQVENFCATFPDTAGEWSGKPLLVVIDGRNRTKAFRALNVARRSDNAEPLKCKVTQEKYQAPLDAQEAVAIGNARIEQTPTQRAWAAYEFQASGKSLAAIAPLVGVTTEQAVKNLLGLCDASEAVQSAVDAGPENGGITQTAALEIVKKGDHDKQDAELQKRLDAAKGKSGREKSKALRGEPSESRPKPVPAKKLAAVEEKLRAADRTGMDDPHVVDTWLAIVAWVRGDERGFDALPDEFRSAVLAAEKRASKAVESEQAAPEPTVEQKEAA